MSGEAGVSAALPGRRSLAGRAWGAVGAAWGAFTGVLPHVLHHVGPLAGTALLAGAAGAVLFGAIGFVAAIPFLLRLRRRFGSWKAPVLALALFAAMFTLSTLIIGPAISGSDDGPTAPAERGHSEHHG